MTEMPKRNTHFFVLDGWRGICALFVALSHLRVLSHVYGTGFVHNSYLFVDFFFVLSGFVLTHTYGRTLVTPADVRNFVIRRFGRLWPLHAAIFLVFVVLEFGKLAVASRVGRLGSHAPFGGAASPYTMVTNILLMNSWGFDPDTTWNGPSWSIGAEFYTYLVFAGVLIFAGKRAWLLAAAISATGAAIIATFSPHYMGASYDYGFFRCLYGFFMGLVLYEIYRRREAADGARRGASMREAAILLGVAIFVGFANEGALTLLAPFLFAGAVYIFAFERGIFSRTLSLPVFRYMGERSYSIYMVHFAISLALLGAGTVAGKILRLDMMTNIPAPGRPIAALSFGGPYAMDAVTVVYLFAVLGTASLTYRFIEVPARRYFNALAK